MRLDCPVDPDYVHRMKLIQALISFTLEGRLDGLRAYPIIERHGWVDWYSRRRRLEIKLREQTGAPDKIIRAWETSE